MRRRLLILYLAFLLLVLPYLLVELLGAPVQGDWRQWHLFGLGAVWVSDEGFLLLLAALAGLLGGAVHGAGSLTHHLARGDWHPEWAAWYLFRPLLGGGLAVLVYFALRGGFVPAGATSQVSPYGVGALSGLAGLFTWHVTRKLRDVFDAIFGSGSGGAGAGGDLPAIEEAVLEEGGGGAAAELRLQGRAFPPDSLVRVAGRTLEPTEVRADRIRCPVPADLLPELRAGGPVSLELATRQQPDGPPVATASLETTGAAAEQGRDAGQG